MEKAPWAKLKALAARVERVVDRVTGADRLKPHIRQQLQLEQVRIIVQLSPLLFGGALLTSIVFLSFVVDTPTFSPTFWWAVAINSLYGLAAAVWWRGRHDPSHIFSERSNVNTTILCAFLTGALWGVAANIMPIDDPSIRAVVSIGVGGMLFVSLLALVSLPLAALAFTAPLVLGNCMALLRFDIDDFGPQAVLRVGFVAITVCMAIHQARAFVEHRSSRSQVDEKKEIIGVLLKEFEANASDWIWGFDSEGRIDNVSKGFTRATGLPAQDLIGADFVHFLHCLTPPNDTLMAQLERDFAARETFADVELCVSANGGERWWRLGGKPVCDHRGDYVGYVGTVTDISARKAAEKQMTALAHSDALTGLLNRAKFTEHLNLCVSRLDRYGAPFALLYVDLDQFKAVNDSRGHLVGDRLLREMAARIAAMVREGDVVARLGGDEFAVILTSDCSADMCAAVAARLVETIKQPVEVDGESISIGGSVGIALAPENGTQADDILRNADMALYRAKADGRSAFRFFESRMDREDRERRALEADLREALERGELILHYQPLVSAVDRQPMGFEALIRWQHPVKGLILPADFIPIAEQSGQIIEIGDWTIQEACRAASAWPDEMTVSVNLSPRHFRDSDIAAAVRKALTASGLSPHRLEIEVTEALLLDDIESVIAKLDELRALGVTIALDDFGTGYASLAYLLKFPFDKVKIDRSLIEAALHDSVARDLLRAIASIGKTLKLRMAAEGVETREQDEFLSDMVFHQLQGFYFAKPLDVIGLPHYLLTQVRSRAGDVRREAEAALAGAKSA